MELIVLYGPPAAGKLTVARVLSSLTGFGVLHNHLTFDLARVLYAPDDARFFPLNADLRLRIVREGTVHGVEGLILTCVYAANSRHDAAFVRKAVRIVEARGGRVDFVRLLCRPDELERRVIAPDRRAAGKPASVEVLRAYLERWDVLQQIPGVPSLALDTTSLQPVDAARRIVRHFGLPCPEEVI